MLVYKSYKQILSRVRKKDFSINGDFYVSVSYSPYAEKEYLYKIPAQTSNATRLALVFLSEAKDYLSLFLDEEELHTSISSLLTMRGNRGAKVYLRTVITAPSEVPKDIDYRYIDIDYVDIEFRAKVYSDLKNKFIQTKKETGSDLSMKTKSNLLDKMGTKIKDMFAMALTGGYAYQLKNGQYFMANDDGELTDVSEFVMTDFSFDGYLMPVPVSGLVKGDLVHKDNENLIVLDLKVDGNSIKTVNSEGTVSTFVPVKTMPMLQEPLVLKVMNPMGGMGTGESAGAINPMMFMMMGKSDDGDNKDMFKMMMMSQMMGGQNPFGQMFSPKGDKK